MKRWYIGDLEGASEHVYLFESTQDQRDTTQCQRYMLRTFNPQGGVIRERFFDRTHTLHKHLCRLFQVHTVQLGELEALERAA
jgi:hypothetical protein